MPNDLRGLTDSPVPQECDVVLCTRHSSDTVQSSSKDHTRRSVLVAPFPELPNRPAGARHEVPLHVRPGSVCVGATIRRFSWRRRDNGCCRLLYAFLHTCHGGRMQMATCLPSGSHCLHTAGRHSLIILVSCLETVFL